MGALFQSRGWLPIVEAPGYFRHPTCILAMQLFTKDKIDRQHIYQHNYLVFGDRVVIDRVFETCFFTVIPV